MLSPEFLAIGGGSSGYAVKNSLRFRASNSAYLQRTPGSAGNRKTWTWSAWLKRGTLGGAVAQTLFVGDRAGASDATYTDIVFSSSDQIAVRGTVTNWRITTAVFRDPSAWYHIVVALDTTQATAANRVRVYVNGSEITAFGTSNNPALNADLGINQAALHALGRDVAGGPTFFDGHMAHVYLIDGQALTPSSFGRTDAATGEWVPTNYSGSYGTNGFRLSFEDATSTTTIGYDSSGAANHMTTSGVSVTAGTTFDQSLDTPTNNHASGSQVFAPSSNSVPDFRAANTEWGQAATNKTCSSAAQFEMRAGKWYWEVTVGTIGGNVTFGVSRSDLNSTFRGTGTVYYRQDGQRVIDGVNSAYGASYVANDVLGFAYDADAGTLTCYKNNSSQGTITIASGSSYGWLPACALDNAGAGVTAFHVFNFGARAFAYTPPTGFAALNTRNLPTPSIKRSRQYFDTRLRTGTGAAASVADLEFAPDLVWIKSRSAATNHNLFDRVRGAQKGLGSNLQSSQYTDANSLSALNSNGYSLGTDASSRGVNVNTATYVDWIWKEGTAPGFDVVTFAGTGAAQAVNHGLGVAPEFMIQRVYDDTLSRTWACWHKNLTSAAYYIPLEGTAAEAVDTTMFNSTAPTSTQFTAGSYNSISTKNSVAYLWASIPGFSQIGSWVGNASADGPVVWCGFRPRFLFLRNRSAASYWIMLDVARNTVNVVTDELIANTANAENGLAITSDIDFLASGFKIRTSDANLNQSGNTFIFAAFADVPFKYARAR